MDAARPAPIRTSASAATKCGTRQSPPVARIVLQTALPKDDDIRQVLPVFLANLPKQVAKITALLAQQKFDELATVLHQIKGSAGMYGFPSLTQLATRGEVAIQTRQPPDTIRALTQQLADLIRTVEDYDPKLESE